MEIQYGGHTDAIGISYLNNAELFEKAVKACAKELIREHDMTFLKLTPEELRSEETLQKLQSLEPVGNGFQIPPVLVEGKIENQRKLAKRDDWKSFSVNGIKVTDWSYSKEKYPHDANGCTRFPAEMTVSDYKEKHIELSAVWNREVYNDFQQEINQEQKISKNDYTRD